MIRPLNETYTTDEIIRALIACGGGADSCNHCPVTKRKESYDFCQNRLMLTAAQLLKKMGKNNPENPDNIVISKREYQRLKDALDRADRALAQQAAPEGAEDLRAVRQKHVIAHNRLTNVIKKAAKLKESAEDLEKEIRQLDETKRDEGT